MPRLDGWLAAGADNPAEFPRGLAYLLGAFARHARRTIEGKLGLSSEERGASCQRSRPLHDLRNAVSFSSLTDWVGGLSVCSPAP